MLPFISKLTTAYGCNKKKWRKKERSPPLIYVMTALFVFIYLTFQTIWILCIYFHSATKTFNCWSNRIRYFHIYIMHIYIPFSLGPIDAESSSNNNNNQPSKIKTLKLKSNNWSPYWITKSYGKGSVMCSLPKYIWIWGFRIGNENPE